MRIIVDTNALNAALSTVTKALPLRSTIPVLEGVYIKAEERKLLLRCTDLNIQIESSIDAAIEKEGAAVLPGRLFAEMAKRLPGESVSIDVKKNTAEIISGAYRTTLQCEDAADYHCMNDVEGDSVIKIAPADFKSMVRGCIFAAAQDDTKPILTGALMEMNQNGLRLIALDGYRLALRTAKIENACADEKEIVAPARSLIEVARILPDEGENAEIAFSRTHLSATGGDVKIIARLMEGDFIKYKQILPNAHSTRVRVNRRELLEGIERVALMARESKSNLIKFSISREIIEITANSEIGRSKEEIMCASMGDDIEIAFNNKYLTDVFKVLEDEEIYMDFNSNVSPCVVRPINGEEYYYLILPVRLFTGM